MSTKKQSSIFFVHYFCTTVVLHEDRTRGHAKTSFSGLVLSPPALARHRRLCAGSATTTPPSIFGEPQRHFFGGKLPHAIFVFGAQNSAFPEAPSLLCAASGTHDA